MKRLALFLAVSAASPALAAECRVPGHEAKPVVRLNATMAEPVYHHVLSKRELTSRNAALRVNQAELGLTTTESRLLIRPKVWFHQAGGGRSCVVLDSVEVDWAISSVRVDIAADYREGSCQYQVIRDHENEHVRLTRGAFEAAQPGLRGRLEQAVRELAATTTTAATAEAAAQETLDRLQARIVPAVQAYQREAKRLNADIDTPDSYARVQARCRVW